MARVGLNHAEVEPGKGPLDAFPAGEYPAQIIESDVVETKDKRGKRLTVTWEILDGEFAGRKAFDGFNIENPSAQAQLIGQQQVKSICEAIGHEGLLEDSEELHNQPMFVRFKVTKDKAGEYPDKNEFVRARSIDGGEPEAKPTTATAPATPAASSTKPAATKAAAPAGAGNSPWRRSA